MYSVMYHPCSPPSQTLLLVLVHHFTFVAVGVKLLWNMYHPGNDCRCE